MKKRNRSAIFFMLPALLVYCCVVVLPALYTAFLSLFKWNGLGEKKFVLFRNYVNLFTTEDRKSVV